MTSSTPVHDTLCQAISLLQVQYLAMDSMMDGDAMWGTSHMRQGAIEVAIKMLLDVLGEVEDR